MNIAVFGWYHHRNAGDDRMQYCMTRWLDGHTLAFLPSGRTPPVQLLRNYDAAIIGGGGLIMKRGGMFQEVSRWVRAVNIPVALMGVSVERTTPELRAEIRDLMDACCFAWFRDKGSLDEVGAHPRAFVAPDMTWLYPYPAQPAAASGIALNLRKQQGLPLAAWRTAMEDVDQRVRPWPLYFEQGGDVSVLQAVLPCEVVPDEFTLEQVRDSATVISGRYHGVQFAIQSGRPFIAVSSLPKTRRFLSDKGLAEWCLSETEPHKLCEMLAKLERGRERVTKQMAVLRSALHEQAAASGQSALRALLEAVGALPPSNRRWSNRVRHVLDLRSYFA